MPKVQVPKEIILETALQLLLSDGGDAVTIVRLAQELGCSTQPISRTFGSMENFREEFAVYVLNYFNGKLRPDENNPLAVISDVGANFLRAAFEEPNLIRFVRANSRRIVHHGGIGAVFDEEKLKGMRASLGAFFGISEEKAAGFIQTAVTYTIGLVFMVVDGTVRISLEEGLSRLREIAVIYLVYAGIPKEKAHAFVHGAAELIRKPES